jgi:hypothetical protein
VELRPSELALLLLLLLLLLFLLLLHVPGTICGA